MALYKIGSSGDEVRKIQEKLATLGFYKGPVDGEFGGGTYAAVCAFQEAGHLSADGVVGNDVWKKLFAEEAANPSILDKPGNYRCLALTGAFETGTGIPECFTGLSGDFDGQGISFGVCQWNFGQGSLQPLLLRMINEHQAETKNIFREKYDLLVNTMQAGKEKLMDFARSIQHPVSHQVYEPWRGMFKALGRTDEFQNIESAFAFTTYRAALDLCSEYGLWSERAAALMFDIKVQNGSISSEVKGKIMAGFDGLPSGLASERLEVERMRIIANRRAEAANRPWVEDVRTRKLCIANGGGSVHGIDYDLENQFGIRLTKTV